MVKQTRQSWKEEWKRDNVVVVARKRGCILGNQKRHSAMCSCSCAITQHTTYTKKLALHHHQHQTPINEYAYHLFLTCIGRRVKSLVPCCMYAKHTRYYGCLLNKRECLKQQQLYLNTSNTIMMATCTFWLWYVHRRVIVTCAAWSTFLCTSWDSWCNLVIPERNIECHPMQWHVPTVNDICDLACFMQWISKGRFNLGWMHHVSIY